MRTSPHVNPASARPARSARLLNPRKAGLFLAAVVASVGLCAWLLRGPALPPKDRLPDLPDLAGKNPTLKTLLLDADREARRAGSGAALGQSARVYHANLFYAQAAQCYPLAEQRESDNPRWPYLHAAALQSLGIGDGVPELLRRAMALDGKNIPALLRLAELELKLEQRTQARADFERILAIAPENTFALLGLARVAMASSEWEDARRRLEQVVTLDPSFGTGYRLLAAVYEQLGETEPAAKTAAAANVRGRPREFPDPWVSELDELCYDVEYLLTREVTRMNAPPGGGRWRLDLLRRLAGYAPDNAKVHLYLGEALLQRNDPSEAGIHLREAVRLDPKNEDAWCVLGAWLAMQGREEDAEAQFSTALKINPASRRAALMLGMLRLKQGRPREALEFLRQGLGQDVLVPLQSIQIYVDTLCRLERMEEAAKFLDELIALRPTTGSLWVCLADLAVRRKDWEHAEQVLRQGLAAAPYNALIAERLAWVLATSPGATPADGEEAIHWARIAAETGDAEAASGRSPVSLAAALARAGRFDEAEATLQQVIEFVRSKGDRESLGELAEQLRRYQARQPLTAP